MIKFNCIIHKETGTVIKYEDWLKKYNSKEIIKFDKYIYGTNTMLFSDDFEIIYNSEFTTDELELSNVSVFECVRRKIIWDNTGNELSQKIENMINKRYENKSKYGIDI